MWILKWVGLGCSCKALLKFQHAQPCWDQTTMPALTTEEHCVSHRNPSELRQTTKSLIKSKYYHFGSREASQINLFHYISVAVKILSLVPEAQQPLFLLFSFQPLPPKSAHPQHHHILNILPTTGTGYQRFYQVRSHQLTFLCSHTVCVKCYKKLFGQPCFCTCTIQGVHWWVSSPPDSVSASKIFCSEDLLAGARTSPSSMVWVLPVPCFPAIQGYAGTQSKIFSMKALQH